MTAEHSTEPESPRFFLLIDPPGCDYDRSSDGLFVALEALTELLLNADDWDDNSSRDTMVAMLRSAGTSLLLITGLLGERINSSGEIEKQVEELILDWRSRQKRKEKTKVLELAESKGNT